MMMLAGLKSLCRSILLVNLLTIQVFDNLVLIPFPLARRHHDTIGDGTIQSAAHQWREPSHPTPQTALGVQPCVPCRLPLFSLLPGYIAGIPV